MTPLSDVHTGVKAVIHTLSGGHDFAARVAVLGFTIGEKVTILQNCGNGPVLVGVRGSRIALGRGEARKILVKLV
jgi:ferrous iron transport protein A